MAIKQGLLHLKNAEGGFDVIYPLTYANLVKYDDSTSLVDHLISQFKDIDDKFTDNEQALSQIENNANKANGFVKLNENGLVPSAFIPAEFKEIKIVDSITARDGLADPFAGLSVYVKDASADSTVNSGGAYYLYDGAAWVKTAEAESMDVVLDWNAIQGKPDTLAGYGIIDGVNVSDVVSAAAANKILKLDADGKLPADVTGNAATASKLQAPAKIGVKGDDVVAANVDFDGSLDADIEIVLSDTGVTAGTYSKVIVDSKGRVTGSASLVAEDIPDLDWAKIVSGKPNTLEGYGITDAVNKAGDTMTGALTLSGAPTQDLHAVTKAYVDSVVQGLDIKESVRLATTENIELSGLGAIDGVGVNAGDRILVKNQTNAVENGIYVAAEGAWERAIDAVNGKVTPGMFTFVESGTKNHDSGFVLTTKEEVVVGTSELTFSQFSGMGQVACGTGLGKYGNEIFIADTGVGAGIYNNIAVNEQGQITSIRTLESGDLPEIAWAVITGKPASSVEDIDDAVSKKHAHANAAQLDKVTEADGVMTYDGAKMATQAYAQSMIQVAANEADLKDMPVGGLWIQTIEE